MNNEKLIKLPKQVEAITEQLESMAKKTYSKTINETNSVISITVDDGQIRDYTTLKPLLDKYGYKATTAVVPTFVGSGGTFMTLEQVKELQNSGWEICSHTYEHQNLSTLSTAEEIEYQMKKGQEWFKENGINVTNLCYPQGGHNALVMDIARKYFRSATTVYQNTNYIPIQTYSLNRYLVDDWTLTQLKTIVDKAITKKQWVIFCCHVQSWSDEEYAKWDELLKYIQASNIQVKTINQALDVFENKLEIGDKDTNFFKIGADGTFETKNTPNYVFMGANSGIKNDTPITSFPKNKVSVCSFNSAENSGIPIGYLGSGTLVTYRVHDDDALAFQVFYSYTHKGIPANRAWNGSAWDEWIFENLDASTIKNATPITGFPKGVTSYAVFVASSNGDIPFNGSIGTLKTYRARNADSLSWQEWCGQGSTIVYRRCWQSNNTWTNWATPYTLKGNTTFDFGTVPANGMSTVDVPITGLTMYAPITANFVDIPNNIICMFSTPVAGILRARLYNLSATLIGVGTKTITYAQF